MRRTHEDTGGSEGGVVENALSSFGDKDREAFGRGLLGDHRRHVGLERSSSETHCEGAEVSSRSLPDSGELTDNDGDSKDSHSRVGVDDDRGDGADGEEDVSEKGNPNGDAHSLVAAPVRICNVRSDCLTHW